MSTMTFNDNPENRKVDEKVFHFLFSHIFRYPQALERFIEKTCPDIQDKVGGLVYEIRLNHKNVDLEISFGKEIGVYLEFKTKFWKVEEAARQVDNYKKWDRHSDVRKVVLVPSSVARHFIETHKAVPADTTVAYMDELRRHIGECVPPYLTQCLDAALQSLPEWRVNPGA